MKKIIPRYKLTDQQKEEMKQRVTYEDSRTLPLDFRHARIRELFRPRPSDPLVREG